MVLTSIEQHFILSKCQVERLWGYTSSPKHQSSVSRSKTSSAVLMNNVYQTTSFHHLIRPFNNKIFLYFCVKLFPFESNNWMTSQRWCRRTFTTPTPPQGNLLISLLMSGSAKVRNCDNLPTTHTSSFWLSVTKVPTSNNRLSIVWGREGLWWAALMLMSRLTRRLPTMPMARSPSPELANYSDCLFRNWTVKFRNICASSFCFLLTRF